MKNKIIGAVSIVAIAVLATVNVTITGTNETSAEISLTNLNSALAEGEWGGWDNFWQGQGFYKDESPLSQPCPVYQNTTGSGSASGSYGGASGSASGSGSNTQVNPSTRTDVRCQYGNVNCTSVGC